MAGSKRKKQIFNAAYSIGAAIVIIGALFKLTHWELGPLNGTILLAIGLLTEAALFIMGAFEPVEEEVDWSLVYPELAGGTPRQNFATTSVQNISVEDNVLRESLSEKLDNILAEARIDAHLMQNLGRSIENFAGAAREIAPVTNAMVATHKYGEELSLAATHLESLNSLYKLQLERTEYQVTAQAGVVDNLNSLNDQMLSLKDNIGNLNRVYGGMLSAMGGR